MQIDIHIPTAAVADDVRSYIERRVKLVLGDFADRLGSVKVRITDVKGPGNSSDKSCEIRVQLLPSRILIMQESRNANLYASIDHGADGIGRSLSRHLERDRNTASIVQTRTKAMKLRSPKDHTAA